MFHDKDLPFWLKINSFLSCRDYIFFRPLFCFIFWLDIIIDRTRSVFQISLHTTVRQLTNVNEYTSIMSTVDRKLWRPKRNWLRQWIYVNIKEHALLYHRLTFSVCLYLTWRDFHGLFIYNIINFIPFKTFWHFVMYNMNHRKINSVDRLKTPMDLKLYRNTWISHLFTPISWLDLQCA